MTQRPGLPLPDKAPPGANGVIPRAEWDRAPWNRWTFQNVRELMPTVSVQRGEGMASQLPSAPAELGSIRFNAEGESLTVSRFLDESFTDGFLVLLRGSVVAEDYANGMTRRTAHLSQSVAKSVVGVLAGILADRGDFDPDEPLTTYLPQLGRTAYRGACGRHLLDMTSGVLFDETYTATHSHMAKLDAAAGWKDRRQPDLPSTVWELVLSLTETECPHGESFRYRSIETDVLAFVLQQCTGLRLHELVSREIWAPLGAEADAYFTVDSAGYGLADGGFNATLRDYARFALMLQNGGFMNGSQIVPAAWLDETRQGDRSKFGQVYREVLPEGSYRNQFWIEDATRRALLCRGVFGQLIYVDPEAEFAAVKLSSWPQFLDARRTRTALAAIRAIRDELAAVG